MIEVSLFTSSGGFVTVIQMPEFQVMPEGILWGSRFFCLNAAGVYEEGFLYLASTGDLK